jgi:hypothetical protein
VFRLDTAADVVRVTIDVAVTNEIPASGTSIYYFSSIGLSVPIEAVNLRAVRSDGQTLGVGLEPSPSRWWHRAEVDLAPDLLSGQTQRLQLSYVIPSLPPRTGGLSRVNDAFATFAVFGQGDPGLAGVEVVVPAGLEVEVVGDEMQRSERGSEVAFVAPAIGDPAAWDAWLIAHDESRLVGTRVVAGGHPIELRSWPGDRQWADYVNQWLQQGVPALLELIEQPWPEAESDLRITESVTPFAHGYAGWYQPSANAIEVSDELAADVILHELTHLWFNEELFSVRWINEGLAEEYASRVLAEFGSPGVAPAPIQAGDPGAQPLNAWSQPQLLDETSESRETYGYNTSWTVMRGLIDEIGTDAMAEVIDAAADGEIPYQGDPTPEQVGGVGDWRRLLDLAEEIGGSQQAVDLFTRLVVTPGEQPEMTARASARGVYQTLEAAGGDWTPPLGVREAMSTWRFDEATGRMETATEVLLVRDRIASTVSDVPVALENAYESGTRDLAEVAELADDLLGAAQDLSEATAAAEADRNPLETVGLLFSDVDADLAAAGEAFAGGDAAAAVERADQVEDALAGAGRAGGQRLGIGAGVLAFGGAAVAIRRRRRRRRPPPAESGPAADAAREVPAPAPRPRPGPEMPASPPPHDPVTRSPP